MSTIRFSWENLGNINEGRPNLGPSAPVLLYRLFQYGIREVLAQEYSEDVSEDIVYKSGKLAGEAFCKNVMNLDLEFNEFVAELQKTLKELKVGVLRVEKADLEKMEFTMTVAEDLDCSGLPVTGGQVCTYDEGFIAGLLKVYTGKEFDVKEVDCWVSGDRVCRFEVKLKE